MNILKSKIFGIPVELILPAEVGVAVAALWVYVLTEFTFNLYMYSFDYAICYLIITNTALVVIALYLRSHPIKSDILKK